MRLIQLELGSGRAVARVDGATPAIVPGAKSMLELAQSAIAAKRNLTAEVEGRGQGESFDYAAALAGGRVLPPLDHPRCSALLDHRNGPHASRQRRGAGQDACEARRRRREPHRLPEDVQNGNRGRQAQGCGRRRAAGMVLQGRRHGAGAARRRVSDAVLRPGWRRGAGGGRPLHGRSGRQAVPPGLRARQRVFRPHHRAAQTTSGWRIPSCAPVRSDRSCGSVPCRSMSPATAA